MHGFLGHLQLYFRPQYRNHFSPPPPSPPLPLPLAPLFCPSSLHGSDFARLELRQLSSLKEILPLFRCLEMIAADWISAHAIDIS